MKLCAISSDHVITNRDKSDNNIIQIIQIGISCHTKYKSSLGHKVIYNCVIPYFTLLMMSGPKILEDPKKQINQSSA